MGHDEGLPVNEEYADKGKFKFTEGQLYKVVFDIKNPDDQEVVHPRIVIWTRT
jgi:hypothetical protein